MNKPTPTKAPKGYFFVPENDTVIKGDKWYNNGRWVKIQVMDVLYACHRSIIRKMTNGNSYTPKIQSEDRHNRKPANTEVSFTSGKTPTLQDRINAITNPSSVPLYIPIPKGYSPILTGDRLKLNDKWYDFLHKKWTTVKEGFPPFKVCIHSPGIRKVKA